MTPAERTAIRALVEACEEALSWLSRNGQHAGVCSKRGDYDCSCGVTGERPSAPSAPPGGEKED